MVDFMEPIRVAFRSWFSTRLKPIAEEKHTQSPNKVTQQEEKDQNLLLRQKQGKNRFPLNSTAKVYRDS